jgi:hypothetical protein
MLLAINGLTTKNEGQELMHQNGIYAHKPLFRLMPPDLQFTC